MGIQVGCEAGRGLSKNFLEQSEPCRRHCGEQQQGDGVGPDRACLETLRGLVGWEHEVLSGDSRDNAQGGGGGGREGEDHFLQGLMGEEKLLCCLGLKPGRDLRRWGPVGKGATGSPRSDVAFCSYLQSSTRSLSSFLHWGSRAGSFGFRIDFRVSRLAFCPGGEKEQVSMGHLSSCRADSSDIFSIDLGNCEGKPGMSVHSCHRPWPG